ncbi:MAG: hypothetical protein KGL39_24290, partial [Patescibacteria group bacterium]|nr:hypothetical protein [Patescibacteria group bacterium]
EINPRNQRNRSKCFALIEEACKHIESCNAEIEGYAIVTWDAGGRSSASWHEGGPISREAVPSFAREKLNNALVITRISEKHKSNEL